MATLLHLSDLHLTGVDNPAPTADHKARIIPKDVAGHRAKLLASSLRGLGESLRDTGEELDCVIITGDIADRGAPAGYSQLGEVLAQLGESLPSRDRILIVPGNHDVDRNATGADRFVGMRQLRAEGYLVGWLSDEEVDSEPVPILTARDDSFVVAGLNSSFFSGSQLDTETDLQPHLDDLQVRAADDEALKYLLASWRSRGNADIARMSGPELQAIHDHLVRPQETGPLRIAGLHHQILPVGTPEEIKGFEGILNLGHFRRWLASNEIDLVLHGHKHDAAVIRDRIDTDGAHGDHEMTILSAPSVSTARGAGAGIGQLIRVASRRPRLSGYEIITVPSVEQGTVTAVSQMARRATPLDETTASGLIRGADIDSTYAQIVAVLDRLPELPTPLVCRVADGESGEHLPVAMPRIPEPGPLRDEWLDTVINWWQSKTPGRAAKFNHGQFLRADARGRGSALDRIVEELGKKQGTTSRALAVLVNQDTLTDGQQFPSFVTLQFVLRRARLDAVAYFRKQEMSHWWPINVVEVARIQRDVVAKITSNIPVSSGSITTVTGMPVRSHTMPTVAVPELDLRVERPGGMLDLVLPLFRPAEDRESVARAWKDLFDWVPNEVLAEGDPRPLLGLQVLADTLQSAADLHDADPAVGDLIDRLEELHHLNVDYNEDKRQNWAIRARKISTRVMDIVQRVLEAR